MKCLSLGFLVLFVSASWAQTYDYFFYVSSLSINDRNKEALKQMAYLTASCAFGAGAVAASAVWRTLPLAPAAADREFHQQRDFEVYDVAGGLVSVMTDILYFGYEHPSLTQGAYRRTRQTIDNKLTGQHSPCQTAYSNLLTIREYNQYYLASQKSGPGIHDGDRNHSPKKDLPRTKKSATRGKKVQNE